MIICKLYHVTYSNQSLINFLNCECSYKFDLVLEKQLLEELLR